MGLIFNAEEVFKMAVRIEQNGAKFYRKAASLQSGASDKELLEDLAAMEDGHEATFTAMLAGLTDSDKDEQAFDPQSETGMYLNALADTHGGEGSPAAADALTGSESMEEVVRTALGLEKESVLFYLGLKDVVPARLGLDKLDDIIFEERKHITQLYALLEDMAS